MLHFSVFGVRFSESGQRQSWRKVRMTWRGRGRELAEALTRYQKDPEEGEIHEKCPGVLQANDDCGQTTRHSKLQQTIFLVKVSFGRTHMSVRSQVLVAYLEGHSQVLARISEGMDAIVQPSTRRHSVLLNAQFRSRHQTPKHPLLGRLSERRRRCGAPVDASDAIFIPEV